MAVDRGLEEATRGGRPSRGQWMALWAAILGWLFDGLEMGLFPLVGAPALRELLDDPEKTGLWMGVMIACFLVGAATGGVLFGWLGDRIGRVRAMMLSVLAYTLFTGLCGVAQDVSQLFLFRFIASLGMGGEWSLGVSLVMEIWPNRSRAWLAGLIGAASNVGFVLIALVGLSLADIIASLETSLRESGQTEGLLATLVSNSGWRLLMIIGAAPALLTFFIRLFVPESERWLEEHARGTTSHWATRDLLGVALGAGGALLIVYLWAESHPFQVENPFGIRVAGTAAGLAVAVVGYLFPAYRFLRRAAAASGEPRQVTNRTIGRMLLGACLSGVALIGTWGAVQLAPTWVDEELAAEMEPAARSAAKAYTQIASGIGAIVGTIGAALLGQLLGRRVAYCLLCLSSLGIALGFFQMREFNAAFLGMAFLTGGLTASFYGWLPLYLPELFATRVRATGQGFSFNFGRILAAIGALQVGILVDQVFEGSYPRACSTICLVYVVGAVLIWLAPETKGRPLPE